MGTNKNIPFEIIQCPACQSQELVFSEYNIICSGCSAIYHIESGVPVMLVENDSVKKESEIHKTFGTIFNYIDHYQKDALEYDYFQKQTGAVRHNERRVREYLTSMVPENKGLILDVGCGSAWVAEKFCKKNYRVVSFDISLKNTTEALKRFPSGNHSAFVGDVFSLPFKPDSFDIIIASEIIEHVTEPELFIKTLFKVLKPGGTLLITTPYKEKIEYSLCIHCNRPTPKSAHLHSFDEKILLSFFNPELSKQVEFYKFGNKALIYLRTHGLLKILPFGVWKLIDKPANLIYTRPISILIKATKN
ncbi:MAG: methyltransferase domain-containing protein [Prolixibacteraceae bacterium]|nr:methyltransferase domain-containing protein [Prolixibacteraceae bacterium]